MTLTSIPSPAEMAERIRKVGDDLLGISRDLASALDSNPNYAEELASEGIDRELIFRLDRFGRGEIHKSLVFATSRGAKKVIKLPLPEQIRSISGVEVLEPDGESHRAIPLHELTAKQAQQVFGSDHIRTLAEQRTWLDSRRSKGRILDCDMGLVRTKEGIRIPSLNITITKDLVRKMHEFLRK